MLSDNTSVAGGSKARSQHRSILSCLRPRHSRQRPHPQFPEGSVDSYTMIECHYTNYKAFYIVKLASIGLTDDTAIDMSRQKWSYALEGK